jgi:hypothetical protein
MGWYSDSDDDDRILTDSLVIQLLGEEGKVRKTPKFQIFADIFNACGREQRL